MKKTMVIKVHYWHSILYFSQLSIFLSPLSFYECSITMMFFTKSWLIVAMMILGNSFEFTFLLMSPQHHKQSILESYSK